MKDTQKALQMAAYLLQYPDQDWRQELPEWEKALAELERPQFQEVFADFFAYIAAVNCKCKLNTDIIKKHYQ